MLKRKMRFRLDELKSKKVGQLRELSTILSVSLVGCIDKAEVIEKLLLSGMIEIIEGSPAILKTTEEFEKMSVGELKESLLSFGLSTQNALEKSELRSRLLQSGRIILTDGEHSSGNIPSSSGYGEAARNEESKNMYGRTYAYSNDDLDAPVSEGLADLDRDNRIENVIPGREDEERSSSSCISIERGNTTCEEKWNGDGVLHHENNHYDNNIINHYNYDTRNHRNNHNNNNDNNNNDNNDSNDNNDNNNDNNNNDNKSNHNNDNNDNDNNNHNNNNNSNKNNK